MNDDLAHGSASPTRRRSPLLHLRGRRPRPRRRLARQDGVSARLGRLHAASEALVAAQAAVELGWARSPRCAGCGSGTSSGSTPTGCCLACSFALGRDLRRDRLDHAGLAAQDLAWRTLHRNRHRPIHWNPAPVQQLLQAHELTRWNDLPAVTAGQVVALLATTRVRVERALDETRLAAAHLALT